MTVTEFLTEVRDQIGDEVTGYRWSNPDLLLYLNAGRRALWALHPEAFYVTEVVVGDYADLDANDDMDLVEHFLSPLMHFVCHRTLSEDSEDANQAALAASHFQLYVAEIGGG